MTVVLAVCVCACVAQDDDDDGVFGVGDGRGLQGGTHREDFRPEAKDPEGQDGTGDADVLQRGVEVLGYARGGGGEAAGGGGAAGAAGHPGQWGPVCSGRGRRGRRG